MKPDNDALFKKALYALDEIDNVLQGVYEEERAAIRAALTDQTAQDTDYYTTEERRVCEYLQEITGGQIGCGKDPIGFIILSHEALRQERAATTGKDSK